MATFKPAYLIHGDDHGRIGERRAALRKLAESESGCNGVEAFEGDAASPAAIARALDAMTFAIGRRFLVVDGAERWKESDVKEHLVPALKAIAPDTTIAFFGRDEGRFKVCAALASAVSKAGGVVATEQMLKAKDLPRWLQGEAGKLGVELDREGAQALVGLVGERQQRLLRELEKLALELGPGARIGRDIVEDTAAHSSERQVWGLVDDDVGRDCRVRHMLADERHAIEVDPLNEKALAKGATRSPDRRGRRPSGESVRLGRDARDGADRLGAVAELAAAVRGELEVGERLERAAEAVGIRAPGLRDAPIGRPRAHLQALLDLQRGLPRLQAQGDLEDVAEAAREQPDEPADGLALRRQGEKRLHCSGLIARDATRSWSSRASSPAHPPARAAARPPRAKRTAPRRTTPPPNDADRRAGR